MERLNVLHAFDLQNLSMQSIREAISKFVVCVLDGWAVSIVTRNCTATPAPSALTPG